MGSRFRKVGYNEPKYMIKAKNRTLFYWSLVSLQSFNQPSTKFIFIVREEDKASNFISKECEALGIHDYSVVEIDHLTDGQATTVLFAKQYWNKDAPLIIYNIDTHVSPDSLNKSSKGDDGWIPCFSAPTEKWSFVKIDNNGFATEVREKTRISDYATIGLYWFSSAALYEETYHRYYSLTGREEKGERYVAPIYNQLIQEGLRVTIDTIPEKSVQILGTPEELEVFMSNDYDLKKEITTL